ncbi:LOW QUALITY PROTEIN: condensin-2 complex subunit H2 [Heliangelus exortis]|uniref:LOW QUALITY PROTEIN: condensin-2 complex subunit H2 n=1 Tax=Heliangelus exortis TaxID=472823 RepID=UPI003A937943
MEEVESRFLHLLQPIRDLTKNWEVDVAAQLGEYLEELDQICISFDNGRTTMNFTEAALLIQGSACVYSRKVEYLYSLVYQALDFISNKKREKLPSSLRPDGTDADATFGAGGKKEEFLSLDDIQDSAQASVDLQRDHPPNAVTIVPLTPLSLVPPEETEKRDNPLLSHRGELLASRRDFRMNTSTPHPTGAFLLELSGLSPICLGRGAGTPRAGAAPSAALARDPIQALSFSEEGGMSGADDDGDIGDTARPEEGVGATPAAKEHTEALRGGLGGTLGPLPELPTPAEGLGAELQLCLQSAPRGYVLRGPPPAPLLREPPDPWQSLDPFGDSEEKPFRKGRPFLVPPGLQEVVGGKRKRRGPRKLQDFMAWFSAAYNHVPERGKAKRKGPTFADLEVLYWRQLRERVAAQRKLQSRGGLCPVRGIWSCWRRRGGAESCEGADDSEEQEELQEDPQDLGALGSPPGPPDRGSLGYEDLVRRNVELFIADSQQYARETELSQHVRCWEERMGPLLQEQEDRASFDIKGYGQALWERCGGSGVPGGGVPGPWCSFASLVAGLPPFEVCRYMLASLQLANEYVVELEQDPGLEQGLDTLRLRLLTPPQQTPNPFSAPSHSPPGPSQ